MFKRMIAALVILFGCLSVPAHAVTIQTVERGFSASATATRAVAADIVSLILTVSDESEKEEEAAKLASQRGESLVGALHKRGFTVGHVQISNVRTKRTRTRIRVRTENGLREQVLVKVSQNLSLTVAGFKKLSDVLEIVFKEGADNIKNVHLGSSQAQTIQDELSLEAVKLASEKARKLASHVDLDLGKVMDVRTRAERQGSRNRGAEPVNPATDSGTLGQAIYSVSATVTFQRK